MYAARNAVTPGARGVSFGAAFAINGLIIAGLIFAAPDIIPTEIRKALDTYNVPEVPPPDPEPLPRPEPKAQPQSPAQHPVVTPDQIIKSDTAPLIDTTPIIPDAAPFTPIPPVGPSVGSGTVTPEPPAPPPLIKAKVDPRANFQPPYPASEIRGGNEGKVSVRVLVGTDGRVKAVERISATSDAFYEATRRHALASWRFKPATQGGVAQESWFTLSVRFELENR